MSTVKLPIRRRQPSSMSRAALMRIAETAVEMLAAGDEPGKGGQDRALTCRRCNEARAELRRLLNGEAQ